jgi:hypothetical protein
MTTRRKPQIPVVLRQRLATRSGDRRDRVELAAANHELRRQPQGEGDAAWASAISYVAECLRRVSRAMPLESAGSHPTQGDETGNGSIHTEDAHDSLRTDIHSCNIYGASALRQAAKHEDDLC